MSLRRALSLFGAALASLALARLLPTSLELGMRGTLAVLPVVAALFSTAAREVGDRLRRRDLGLAAAWCLLALAQGRLGFPRAAPLVVGLGFAAAALRLTALLPRLLRRLGGSAADAPLRWPLFALPLAAYLLTWPWATASRAPDGDEPYYLLLAHSLVEDLDVDLADEYRDRVFESFSPVEIAPQPGDPTGPDGAIYSRHSALLPLALAPFYALGGARGAQLAMLLAAAALAAATAAAARQRFPDAPRGVLLTWLLLAFLPPLLIYAPQLWVEVPAALLVALALRALARSECWGKADLRWLATLVLPLAALPLLKLRFLALTLPLTLLALVRLGRHNRRLQLALVGSLGAVLAALALWNVHRYGNPLRMHAAVELDLVRVPIGQLANGTFGLLFDVAFGLFATAPLWLLLLPATARLLRHAAPPLSELLAALPYLLFVASRQEWYGGWSPPFRYGVVLLPIFALVLVPWLDRQRRGFARAGLELLAAASLPLALLFLVEPAWTYSLADGGSRAMSELATRYSGDFLRLLPSAIRPRPANGLWLGVALLAAILFALSGRARRARPRATLPLALALLLGAGALGLVAARTLPTRRVEVEDAWIAKRGGAPHPERWTIDRTRFDQGWTLAAGSELSFRPVPAGNEVTLTLRWYQLPHDPPPVALELVAGESTLATLEPPPPGSWQARAAGPFAWHAGDTLRLRVSVPRDLPRRAPEGALIIDRVLLDWR